MFILGTCVYQRLGTFSNACTSVWFHTPLPCWKRLGTFSGGSSMAHVYETKVLFHFAKCFHVAFHKLFHDLVLSRKHLAILIGMLRARCKLEPTIIIEELGEGRIRATWGWISVDRGSKATLPLTMPRRVFKSSAKDSAHRPLGRELRGGRPRHIGRTGLANGTGPWGRKRP